MSEQRNDIQKIDRYQVIRELGRGGMASVFLASDPRFQRHVALKLLPREFLHDPGFKARFEREAQTIAALEHPAIVAVYDFGEDEDRLYLVMRYMPGGSLADQIKKGPIPLSQAVSIIERIGSALDYAHSKAIIHRDLKPANILFDQFGNTYLADFGIARPTQTTAALTATGAIIGTPEYMSPEQVQGDEQLDGRSDIYSLGIILYEMLTGRQPYRADTPAKVMMKHVLESVPNIRAAKPDLPSGTESIINRAMAKKRENRYKTAAEMENDLRNLLSAKGSTGAAIAVSGATVLDQPQSGTSPKPHTPPEAVKDRPPPSQQLPSTTSPHLQFKRHLNQLGGDYWPSGGSWSLGW